MSILLTPAQLAAVAPDSDAEVLAPTLAAQASIRMIDTPRRLAHWLAQLHVETAAFTAFQENLNYSAKRLMQVWPKRFPTLLIASAFVGKPEALAEKVYGGRMGNTQPGDGFRYIGRGPGLTGRDNYRRYGKLIGVDLEAHPELAAQPDAFAKVAAIYWQTHNLNPAADADDIASITEAWNGGLIGLPERRAALVRYKAVLGIRTA